MKPMRQFLGLFDEDQSNENAKHIVRTMRENPWPDFLNGSRLPFGYRSKRRIGADAERRLVISAPEAELVRQTFDHTLGRHGPALDIKPSSTGRTPMHQRIASRC